MLLRNPIVSLGLAVILGLVAAVFAAHWIQNRAKAVEADLRDSRPVVVAAIAVANGAQLRAEDLKLLDWPRNSVPEGSYDNIKAVVGKYSAQKLLPGELVFKQRVLETAGNSLSTQIEPSKRAVTVRVNDVIGVAGFLLPGNRVDVLATRVDAERRATTRTLLQNIRVLAVDQTAQVEKDEPVVVRAVTLELDPLDAEQLVGATEEGTVQLALRNPEDQGIEGIASNTPGNAAPSTSKPHHATSAKDTAGGTVTIIRQAQAVATRLRP